MKNSIALPNLKIIPTEALVLHEACEQNRLDNINRSLFEVGTLQNPIVVTKMPKQEKYMVIDGANRSTTFIKNNVPHILAQVIDYHDAHVSLSTWHHILSDMSLDLLHAGLQSIQNIEIFHSTHDEHKKLGTNGSHLNIISEEMITSIAFEGHQQNGHYFQKLTDVVNVYKTGAFITRSANTDWHSHSSTISNMTAIVMFPQILPTDVITNALNGILLPCGITRHIIRDRCLNLNFPLSILMAQWSLEDKNEWLKQWVHEQLNKGKIRHYPESTFQFNE